MHIKQLKDETLQQHDSFNSVNITNNAQVTVCSINILSMHL